MHEPEQELEILNQRVRMRWRKEYETGTLARPVDLLKQYDSRTLARPDMQDLMEYIKSALRERFTPRQVVTVTINFDLTKYESGAICREFTRCPGFSDKWRHVDYYPRRPWRRKAYFRFDNNKWFFDI